MLSSSTCMISPIARCTARLVARRRELKPRTTSAMAGISSKAIRLSCQLSQNIQAKSPITASESLTSVVSTPVAAPVTPVTS